MKMKTIIFCLFTFLLCTATYGQSSQDSMFDEANYKEIARGAYPPYEYAVTYCYRNDSNYLLRKVYSDNQFNEIIGKLFFLNDTMNGPYEFYSSGSTISKGFKRMGKEDGEKYFYHPAGLVSQKAFYKNGIRNGVWEYFDVNGKLYKKEYYHSNGKVEKTEVLTSSR